MIEPDINEKERTQGPQMFYKHLIKQENERSSVDFSILLN